MTDRLVEILFSVTGVLLIPTLMILLFLFAATLWMCGDLAREAFDRRKSRRHWKDFIKRLQTGEAYASQFHSLRLIGYPSAFQKRIAGNSVTSDDHVKKNLDDVELDMARRLSWLSFLTRVGPMLGLVGTLLPLGPALRGLASDDLGTLASNLEVAFTSTVFGLLIGGLAYGANMIRRNWYDQDLSDLEFMIASGLSQDCANVDSRHSDQSPIASNGQPSVPHGERTDA